MTFPNEAARIGDRLPWHFHTAAQLTRETRVEYQRAIRPTN